MQNLSIFNSSWFKSFSKLFLFLLLGIVINLLLDSAFAEAKRDWIKAGKYYPREQWEEFYKIDKNSLDLAILGSSRAFYGISPQILQKETNLNCFNFGSPAQPFPASYYSLQEILESHDIKYLVMEVHYEMLIRFYTRPYKVYIMENIRNRKRKTEFFLKGFRLREMGEYFLPILNAERSITYIFSKLAGHPSDDFSDDETYTGLGFVKSNELLDTLNYEKKTYRWNKADINPETIRYYEKIIELANRNNIQVFVVNFPYPSLTTIENEEEFWQKYREFVLISENVTLLNYHNSELDFSLEEYFDVHHLNWQGAQKISKDIGLKLKKFIN